MQNIIIEKPYRFIPPWTNPLWQSLVTRFNLHAPYLRRSEGVTSHEVRHADRLRASLAAGHGILVAPNHPRTADPIVMGWLAGATGCCFHAMASWHLFHKGWVMREMMRAMGGFSVYREGVDRPAIDMAIRILETAKRPLVIFPEGASSRTNDKLHALLDGVAFIARTAAKKRARVNPELKVVVHPVAIKYLFRGDLLKTVDPMLTEIEHRLTWHPRPDLPLLERISTIGLALLSLKELEYFKQPQTGSLADRMRRLIDRLLHPLEQEWLGSQQSGSVVPRVKALRMKILPDMVRGELAPAERERRWRQLADIYLSQQLSCYPHDYLQRPSVDRLLETVERFEEDLTDKVRVHGNLHAVIEVGEALEVSTERDRQAEVDPLMARLESTLQSMLDQLATESAPYRG